MAKCKILFLAANPTNTETLRLDEEIREIKNKIRMSDLRDALEFTPRVAVRRSDLLQALNEEKPTIVHFSGHGSDAGEIYLQNDQKIAAPVSTEILADLFRVSNDDNNIKLVILNACYSLLQAPEIIKNVDFVIGMSREIPDQSARMFSASFYSALGFGKTIQNAFDQGKHEILETERRLGSETIDSNRGLSFDESNLSEVSELAIPQLLVRDGCDPKTTRLVAPRLGWQDRVQPFVLHATPVAFLVFAFFLSSILNWWVIAVSSLLPITAFEIAKSCRMPIGTAERKHFYFIAIVSTLLVCLRFISLPANLVGYIEIEDASLSNGYQPVTKGHLWVLETGKSSERIEIQETGQFTLKRFSGITNHAKIKLRIEVEAPCVYKEEREFAISELNSIRLERPLPPEVKKIGDFAQEIRTQMYDKEHQGKEIQNYVGRQLRVKIMLEENSKPNFTRIGLRGDVDRKSYEVQFDFMSTLDRLANLKKGSEVRIKGKVEEQTLLDSNHLRIVLKECEVIDE